MMQELGRAPDYFASPERWMGHQPADSCPVQEPISPQIIDEKQKLREKLDKEVHGASWKYIADYLESPEEAQDRKFGPGTAFDANNFEDGTIIEIRSESGHWANGKNFSYGRPYTPLGVVCRTKENGAKIALYYKAEGVGPYLFITYQDPVISIGDVEHTKQVGENPSNFYDSVKKVNSVTILKAGNGKKERKPLFSRLFVPIPHMGPQIVFK